MATVVHASNLSTEEAGQADLELEASLVCMVSARVRVKSCLRKRRGRGLLCQQNFKPKSSKYLIVKKLKYSTTLTSLELCL